MRQGFKGVFKISLLPLAAISLVQAQQSVDGLTFVNEPSKIYVSLKAIAGPLGWQIGYDPVQRTSLIDGQPFQPSRKLFDGSALLTMADLKEKGVQVEWNPIDKSITIIGKAETFSVVPGQKRVQVDKARQVLEAYQGDTLVLTTNISSGRPGHGTPNGNFKTGWRARMHYSSLYNNSPMPWSVQINGNIFFHGYHSVPKRPASHGCIRVPLNRGNPAKHLFEWLDRGAPVEISGTWTGRRTDAS